MANHINFGNNESPPEFNNTKSPSLMNNGASLQKLTLGQKDFDKLKDLKYDLTAEPPDLLEDAFEVRMELRKARNRELTEPWKSISRKNSKEFNEAIPGPSQYDLPSYRVESIDLKPIQTNKLRNSSSPRRTHQAASSSTANSGLTSWRPLPIASSFAAIHGDPLYFIISQVQVTKYQKLGYNPFKKTCSTGFVDMKQTQVPFLSRMALEYNQAKDVWRNRGPEIIKLIKQNVQTISRRHGASLIRAIGQKLMKPDLLTSRTSLQQSHCGTPKDAFPRTWTTPRWGLVMKTHQTQPIEVLGYF
ncbi:hypothetical protein PIB30_070572 [Stylosanthes scabra]|uniref:Uncharacterized protein n=1 Tax=Stylosanthes scabra TaxID=79078 RepID=A0ABU6UMC8_9FABA|nr:hypothetical protein [Stylosanthes scabra]